MALKWLEGELRRAGNPQDNGFADVVKIMRENHGDFPLPSEIKESPIQVDRFSEEALEALEFNGYRVYELTGQSVASLRKRGKKFHTTQLFEQSPSLITLTSRNSEIAIKPSRLFLPKSARFFEDQVRMVDKYSKEVSKKMPGVKAVIGELPDYIELAYAHLDLTGNHNINTEKPDVLVRTNTNISSSIASETACMSFEIDKIRGIYITERSRFERGGFTQVAPLLIPSNIK